MLLWVLRKLGYLQKQGYFWNFDPNFAGVRIFGHGMPTVGEYDINIAVVGLCIDSTWRRRLTW